MQHEQTGLINAVKLDTDKKKLEMEDVLKGLENLSVKIESVIQISPVGGNKEMAIKFDEQTVAADLVGKQLLLTIIITFPQTSTVISRSSSLKLLLNSTGFLRIRIGMK